MTGANPLLGPRKHAVQVTREPAGKSPLCHLPRCHEGPDTRILLGGLSLIAFQYGGPSWQQEESDKIDSSVQWPQGQRRGDDS